jgi:peroxiredoxin
MLAIGKLVTRMLSCAALLALVACGGTQVGSTDPTGDGEGGQDQKTTTDGANPCATAPEVGESVNEGLGKAADATILAGDGSHVQLNSAWLNSTAVVIFYRGHWCPFCQRQLSELQANVVEFEKLNANLIAVSADPEDIEKMQTKSGVKFELYADPDLVAIKAFDVLDEPNGISRPAVFIVDQKGMIRFRYVGENASDRILLKVLLAELEKIQREEGKI